jgi:hypothetical protein
MESLRIPLLRGRYIADATARTRSPSCWSANTMAKQFWPNEDPVGKRLKLTFFPDVVREVVGVVGDVKDRGLDKTDPVSDVVLAVSQSGVPESMGTFHGFR